jgi:hypothetical protein
MPPIKPQRDRVDRLAIPSVPPRVPLFDHATTQWALALRLELIDLSILKPASRCVTLSGSTVAQFVPPTPLRARVPARAGLFYDPEQTSAAYLPVLDAKRKPYGRSEFHGFDPFQPLGDQWRSRTSAGSGW